jgi:hypothetical protein
MRALSSADYLRLWERAVGRHPLDQGLAALAMAHPEESFEALADWPLGRRNGALAELYCACFGRSLSGQISCPQCAERLEFHIDAQALVKTEPQDPMPAIKFHGSSFRIPATRDLARAARQADSRMAAVALVESCRTDGAEVADWRDVDIEEIGDRMAAADPMAEIRLTFLCAKCSHQWEEDLDLGTFIWLEIAERSKRLLWEVHTLAAAYGWSEHEILSFSEPRRRLYLKMVHA